jgi:hypothetical protein
MADMEAQQQPKAKLLSRFKLSACNSTGMAASHKHIVPLPACCTLVDAARWLIALAVLAFTAAAAGIWGGSYTAFGFTLFTVSQAAFRIASRADCRN